MARYRDERGRFLSSSETQRREAEGGDLFSALFGQLVKRDQPEQFEPGDEVPGFYAAEPNWYEDDKSGRVLVWTTGDPREPMDQDAIDESSAPFGYSRYQIRFSVPDNPDYPRGYASYTPLHISEWPPSETWGSRFGATGIGAIVFSRD